MTKEQFREVFAGRSVKEILFEMFSSSQIEKQSVVECVTHDFYSYNGNERKPLSYGPLDTKLGVSFSKVTCSTCSGDLATCVGHFGSINLKLPCFHSGYMRKIIQVLQCICKECGSLLALEEDKRKAIKIMMNKNLTDLQFKALSKKFIEKSKKNYTCPKCFASNGVVKKYNSIKITHEFNIKSLSKKKVAPSSLDSNSLQEASKYNSELLSLVSKHKNFLTPLHVLKLFEKIPSNEYLLLGMRGDNSPVNMIIQRILVPPACIRPSVISDVRSGSNEDDLSIKLSEIIFKNNSLILDMKKGYRMESLSNNWDTLQMLVCMYLTGDVKGVPLAMTPKDSIRCLIQRLKGKHGRFRGNLSGKRVDFSGRTVISPDPNIRVDQVIVPLLMALVLTFPEEVNRYNIEKLRATIRNGPDIHPGANFLILSGQINRRFLRYGNREEIAKNLKPGDIVERHLSDDDVVLFNRQPSLHRISIMAHKVKVLPSRTLRFNECVCTPYNADFDGDEMNIHLPQTHEARAEAYHLMGVKNNITTPRNGDPLISSTQDFITGAFLLTHKDTFLNRREFSRLSCSFLGNADETTIIDIPIPAILKPNVLWTGKQVISCMIRPNSKSPTKINLRTKGKSYTSSEELCVNDSYVVFYNGQHVCGTLDKATIGSGSKSTIFYKILKEYGSEECVRVMLRLNRITTTFLTTHGFSIGINDVTASRNLIKQMDVLVSDGYTKCNEYIEECEDKRLATQPGCTLEETLEAVIIRELSTIRELSGKICLKELHPTCSPLIMALCGSKGSFINISQMIACVGQQAISGKRTPNGFEDRSLPRFPRHSKTPEAKGFVRNSFYTGLTPTEFYFHAMAGREGLVDTAVKTAETGYMQRRLVKCLEDLCVQYDNTVRTSHQSIVQFLYGGDGLDPIEMEGTDQPIDFLSFFNNCYSIYFKPTDIHLSSSEIKDYFTDYLISSKADKKFNPVFLEQLTKFVNKLSDDIKHTEQVLNALKKQGISNNSYRNKITLTVLNKFLSKCSYKYAKSIIEPGTTVGALCAQSIGEPATQMTLKTFHFAGVATMNITLGVPRLKEIINATLNIATPIISVPIEINDDIDHARRIKGRIEKTTLGQVCSTISEIYSHEHCCILIKLDINRIKLLQLEINVDTVLKTILSSNLLKLKQNQVSVAYPDIISIFPQKRGNSSKYFVLQQMKGQLSNLLIKGFSTISRAIVHIDENHNSATNSPKYKLLVEGNDLASVMSTRSVIPTSVTTNNTMNVNTVLGIEAARTTIINEIVYTMKNHGISVDLRHIELLADLMTYKGEVLGITRYGLSKMKEGVLMLASFEKTGDHLFDAAYYGSLDDVQGVSESIIMGNPMNVGTGLFRVLQKPKTPTPSNYMDTTTSLFERAFEKSIC